MQFIGEFLVRVANLAEAEGRLAWDRIAKLAVAILLFALAMIIFLLAVIALSTAAFLGLLEVMHPAGALAIVGFTLLSAAAAVTLMVNGRLRS